MKQHISPQKAIRAKCTECIYDPVGGGGTDLQQIEACTATNCPLYEWRPLTGRTKERLKNERIAMMSDEELEEFKRRSALAKERFSKHLNRSE